ncbi:MAG: beta-ketoacyl-ACP synthase [Proteobacteria bacterium]|nr:beta-ketoacyl-ACP synthase [Pseudomonadota bacterium]
MTRRRVVVTGLAGVCPVGSEWPVVREALRNGVSGVRHMEDWGDVEGLATRLGATVEFERPGHWPRKKVRSMGRVAELATWVTEKALSQAGLLGDPALSAGRVGVAYGSTTGAKLAMGTFVGRVAGERTTKGVTASDFVQMMSHTTSANLAQFFEIRGRQIPTCSACTSGSQAIGAAYEAIRFGLQDCMVAGGSEELDVMDAAAFDVMFATGTRNDDPSTSPRPFDATRDGLVVAEGAATLILEELEHARARGATLYGEILGYGTNCDGKHVTNPDAAGMQGAMQLALDDAGIASEAVGYVNAHATATPAGDVAESQATAAVFGRVPVSSLKSYFGHTLGACGAIEAWLTLEMQREGWFAPTLNLNEVDSDCADLDYLQHEPRDIDAPITVSNNFAFGGVNTSLVLARPPA